MQNFYYNLVLIITPTVTYPIIIVIIISFKSCIKTIIILEAFIIIIINGQKLFGSTRLSS